jgi:hypothetical protein
MGLVFLIKQELSAVRVVSILLDESHPRFKELGEWNGLGTIEYEDIYNANSNAIRSIAKPFFQSVKHYLLINEIVLFITTYLQRI